MMCVEIHTIDIFYSCYTYSAYSKRPVFSTETHASDVRFSKRVSWMKGCERFFGLPLQVPGGKGN